MGRGAWSVRGTWGREGNGFGKDGLQGLGCFRRGKGGGVHLDRWGLLALDEVGAGRTAGISVADVVDEMRPQHDEIEEQEAEREGAQQGESARRVQSWEPVLHHGAIVPDFALAGIPPPFPPQVTTPPPCATS